MSSNVPLIEGERQIAWARRQFNRAVSRANSALRTFDLLACVVWVEIAADLAWHRHPGFYSSSQLESLLLDVSQLLPQCRASYTIPSITRKRKLLHVMTEAGIIGGHTRAVERWIKNDKDSAHSILLTRGQFVPSWLESAAKISHGWVLSLSAHRNLLDRATSLRKISREWADLVVLHVHPNDPLPVLAFGVDDGPPVVLFNHADLSFWLGISIADLVLDLRPTAQTRSLNRRGARDSRILPIPLAGFRSVDKKVARAKLGISANSVVLLSIGAISLKYASVGQYDFLKVATSVLSDNPNAQLIVVGPEQDERWKEAELLMKGRIMRTEPRTDLRNFFYAADIYLPSYPFGGLTAELEAGLTGIPVLGMSIPESPGVSAEDDIALTASAILASTIEEYKRLANKLIVDSEFRVTQGRIFREKTRDIHLNPGWSSYYANALRAIPKKHHVRLPFCKSDITSEDTIISHLLSQAYSGYDLKKSIEHHMQDFPASEIPIVWLQMWRERWRLRLPLDAVAFHAERKIVRLPHLYRVGRTVLNRIKQC